MAFFSWESFVVLGWSLYLPYVRLTGNKAMYFRENLLTLIIQEILGTLQFRRRSMEDGGANDAT